MPTSTAPTATDQRALTLEELREQHVRAIEAAYGADVTAEAGARFDATVAAALDGADRPSPCDMKQGEPYDFAWCEAHDTTFALGEVCKWHGKDSVVDVLQDEADEQRAARIRAEIQLGAMLMELKGHLPVPCARCGQQPVLVPAADPDNRQLRVCGECSVAVAAELATSGPSTG